jgi:ABC-type branched-subunit amino acid transport system substrate-binding protein
MKKWYNVPSILVVIVMLVGVFTACGAKPPVEPVSTGPITINVGVCAPLSGVAASYGKLGQETVDMYLQVFNREGFKVGNQTYNFKVITRDDQANSEGGAAASKQLIFEDGCKFIVGHWGPNFKAIQAVTNPAKVIFMTHTGADAVPGPGGYDPKTMPYVVFPVAAHELVVAYVLGIAQANPNYSRIGIVDPVLNKSVGWENADKTMDEKGVRYFHQWYQPNTVDYVPFITKCAEEGCDIIYTTDMAAALSMLKQRWELGYKDMKISSSGPISFPQTWINTAGYDAVQGYIASWGAVWEVKDRTLNEKQIAMLQETMTLLSEKAGKPWTYTGWTAWTPTQLNILAQAMQRAGTVDDTDAIMKEIRGGTFDLTTGRYTFCGAQTYGSPVVLVTGILQCQVQGDKEVYYSQFFLPPIP